MKKVITVIGIFGLIFVQAQVGINTDTPDADTDLELGSVDKALLLNRVASVNAISSPKEGMLIFDATEHCLKVYQNSAWVAITQCTKPASLSNLDCQNAIFSPATAQVNTAYTGTLSVTYTGENEGVYEAQSISSTGVTGLIATIAAGTLANGTGTLQYTVSGTATSTGTATFDINIGGKSCAVSINVANLASLSNLGCQNATFSPATAQVNTAYTGTLSIAYTGGNEGIYEEQSISSKGVTGLTATIAAGTLANGAGTLEYNVSGTATSAGTASFAINIGGQTCTATINIAEALPPTITLHESMRFIASVYDTDYHPYTTPTGPATLATNVAANGTADHTIDVQGKITTTGINIKIPATATGNGTLPAYSTTINIPANMTQDGVARDITLSWASQAYTAATKFINATIKAEVGDLLAKKLDIQTGIGNDTLGVLMGAFSIPSNSAGAMVSYEVRNIAAIPDRRFHETTNIGGVTKRYHDFVYLPVVVKGTHNVNGDPYEKVWLNMNLGAEYTKVESIDFNPTKALSGDALHGDANTHGSLFQWQRKADGHEFRNSQTTSTLATSWAHTSTSFIIATNSSTNYNWVDGGQNDTSGANVQLWQTKGSNNPCPEGYHIPTKSEWQDLHHAITGSIGYIGSSVFFNQSILPNFAAAGYRSIGSGSLSRVGSHGEYWSSYTGINSPAFRLHFESSYSNKGRMAYRPHGFSARCIKD